MDAHNPQQILHILPIDTVDSAERLGKILGC